MKPIEFKERNKLLYKPINLTDLNCRSLAVFTNGKVCISCWKLTLWERMKALFMGRIWLTVLSGMTQHPVKLACEWTAFEKSRANK